MIWMIRPACHLKQIICLIILYIFVLVGFSGCAAVFLAGAGAGAYSYIAGNLSKVYETDYRQAVRVSTKVVSQLEFKLSRQTGDALKTVLEGKRVDDTPVYITVERVDDKLTRIGVRSGYVGFTSLEVSEQIHDKIARNLPNTKRRTTTAKISVISRDSKKVKATNEKKRVNKSSPQSSVAKQVKRNSSQPSSETIVESKEANQSLPRSTLFIFYQSSEIEVPASSFETLNGVVGYLRNKPRTTINIRGYTDSFGDSATNLSLSRKRAQAVKNYLTSRGVDDMRISTEGYGGTNFLESNKTEKLRALNRRVELHIK